VVLDDPFGNDRVLFFDVALFEIFQRRNVCFPKEFKKGLGRESKRQPKLSAGNKYLSVYITRDSPETVLELQPMTDREPRADGF